MIPMISGILTMLCLAASILSIKREPRRILNGFLLQTTVVLAFITLVAYSATNGQRQLGLERFLVIALYVLIFILGLALIVDFALVVKREGISIPNFLPFLFGILAMIVAAVGYNDVTSGLSGSMQYVKVMSVLQNITLYLPFAIGSVLIYSIIYLLLPKKKDVNYIVVLGCGLRKNGEVTPLLRGRLDRAIRAYHRGNEKAKFVTSGGKGRDEIISESQSMKNYLISKGIPKEQIIMEDQSVNTKQNLMFSKKRIEEDGLGGDILISTSNYHVLRAVIYARALGLDGQGIGGHTALYYLPVAFIREYIAMIFQYKLLVIVYMAFAIVTGLWF